MDEIIVLCIDFIFFQESLSYSCHVLCQASQRWWRKAWHVTSSCFLTTFMMTMMPGTVGMAMSLLCTSTYGNSTDQILCQMVDYRNFHCAIEWWLSLFKNQLLFSNHSSQSYLLRKLRSLPVNFLLIVADSLMATRWRLIFLKCFSTTLLCHRQISSL